MSALERAFHLARSGRVRDVEDLITSLQRDGYATGPIEEPILKRKLRDWIKAEFREAHLPNPEAAWQSGRNTPPPDPPPPMRSLDDG